MPLLLGPGAGNPERSRILCVAGDGAWTDETKVRQVLDGWLRASPVPIATLFTYLRPSGAERMAAKWAREHGIPLNMIGTERLCQASSTVRPIWCVFGKGGNTVPWRWDWPKVVHGAIYDFHAEEAKPQ
jgi:hypothetical protein